MTAIPNNSRRGKREGGRQVKSHVLITVAEARKLVDAVLIRGYRHEIVDALAPIRKELEGLE